MHAVRGDQDVGLDHLPKRRVIEAGGKRIGLVHGHRPRWIEWPGFTWNMFFGQHFFLAPRFYVNVVRQFAGEQVDCIVCGHLHRPYIGHVNGILLVNPGSSLHQHPRPPHPAGRLRLRRHVGDLDGDTCAPPSCPCRNAGRRWSGNALESDMRM